MNASALEGPAVLPQIFFRPLGRRRSEGRKPNLWLVSDAALPDWRRDFWARARPSGGSSPAARGKARFVGEGALLSCRAVYLCLGFHLVHRTAIVVDPCWDASLQPPPV